MSHKTPPAQMVDPTAGPEFFKTTDPYGTGRGYRPAVVGMWKSDRSVLFQQRLDPVVVKEFGGAAELWQRYDFLKSSSGVNVSITLHAVNKTATRITESWWLRFNPKASAALKPSSMRLSKLGALIDPLDIVFNGSKTLHGLDEGGIVYGDKGSFQLASLDGELESLVRCFVYGTNDAGFCCCSPHREDRSGQRFFGAGRGPA